MSYSGGFWLWSSPSWIFNISTGSELNCQRSFPGRNLD
jgi:hypothetical protein